MRFAAMRSQIRLSQGAGVPDGTLYHVRRKLLLATTDPPKRMKNHYVLNGFILPVLNGARCGYL